MPTHLSKHIPFRFPPPAAERTSGDSGPEAKSLPMPNRLSASRPQQPRMPPPTHLCGISPAAPATKAAPVRSWAHPPPPPPPKRQKVEPKVEKNEKEKEAPTPKVEKKEEKISKQKELSPTSPAGSEPDDPSKVEARPPGTTQKAKPGETYEIPLRKPIRRLRTPPKVETKKKNIKAIVQEVFDKQNKRFGH